MLFYINIRGHVTLIIEITNVCNVRELINKSENLFNCKCCIKLIGFMKFCPRNESALRNIPRKCHIYDVRIETMELDL